MRKVIFNLSLFLFLWSCDPGRNDLTGKTDAYVPVYSSAAEINDIKVEQPKPTSEAGKIYAYGRYIFQNDLNTGIHIIDNSDHGNPVKIAFLKLPLSSEIAVKGNYLYSNNYVDLVVFDIIDPTHPNLVKRLNNVFPPVNQQYPSFSSTYFQCPDKSKGLVIKWEIKNIDIPNCRR